MRSQQRKIFDAILQAGKGGNLNLEIAFLTLQDLMECAEKACSFLGMEGSQLNRNTVQAWLRNGVITETERTDRNRLFSFLDVFRLASVFAVTHAGMKNLDAAKAFANHATELFKKHFGVRWQGLNADAINAPFDPEDFVWATTDKGMWRITAGGSADHFRLAAMSHGVTVMLNARWLADFCIAVVQEKLKEKMIWYHDHIKAQLQKQKGRRRDSK